MYRGGRIFFSLAVLSAISLCAADIKAEMGKAVYEQNFNQAVELFNKADYDGSFKLFSELFEKKPDDSRVNFYLGRAALEIKQYEDALMAFERVLIVEPTHIRSRLEMARAYFELKEFDAADVEFDKVLESDIPKNVREQILAYKKAMDAAKKRHFINGYLMVGLGYDSNINNGIGTKDYTIASPFGALTLTGDSPKMDYYHTQVFGLNHIWDLQSVKNGLFWQDGFTAYFQTYRQNITSNARYFSLTTGPGYRTKEYEVSVALSVDKLVYGPSFPYMQTISIGPKGSYKLSDTLIVEGSFILKNKFYPYANNDRNALYEEVYAGIRKLIPSSGSMVTFGVTNGKDMERMNDNAAGRTDVSNNFQKYSVSLYHPLKEGLDMTAGISATKTQYPETDSSFLRNENDFALNYSLGIIKTLDKSSMLSVNGAYTNNKSNIENKVYNKRGLSLSYIYNF